MLGGLELIVNPYFYFGSSFATDAVATYLNVRKNGPGVEKNTDVREAIEREDAKALFKDLPKRVLANGVVLGLFFVADYSMGIHDAPLNMHKAFCYAWGTVQHLQAASHFAQYLGYSYLQWVPRGVAAVNRKLNLYNN